MTFYKNDLYAKIVLTALLFLISIDILGLAVSINDIFYLKNIAAGIDVPESDHTFFIQKNQVEYWVSSIGHIFYGIVFLTWFYRAYKNVYLQTDRVVPCKPAVVPFSFLIPVFNFYGPYQIMKFIWQENKLSNEQEKADHHKIINLWWFLSLLTVIYSRVCSGKYRQAEYAEEYLTATYLYIFLYAISIHLSFVTIKIIKRINKVENATADN